MKKFKIYTCRNCNLVVSWKYGNGSMADFLEGTARKDKPMLVESMGGLGKICKECAKREATK